MNMNFADVSFFLAAVLMFPVRDRSGITGETFYTCGEVSCLGKTASLKKFSFFLGIINHLLAVLLVWRVDSICFQTK